MYGGFNKISSVKFDSVGTCALQAESDDDAKHNLILPHKALAKICETSVFPLGTVTPAVGLPVLVPSPEQADSTNKKPRHSSVFIYFPFGETLEKLENYIDRFDRGLGHRQR